MIRRFSSENRGASTVVGVVLLVGIVVILGAIVATFALGLGEEVQSIGPSATIEFECTDGAGGSADCSGPAGSDKLSIEHASGDTLETSRISISRSSVSGANVGLDEACTGLGDEMTAGSSFSIAVQYADKIRIVWTGPDSTSGVAKWSGPAA